MPSHQKAPRSSKKKAKSKDNKHASKSSSLSYSAEQLVQAADQAALVQDPMQALNLYTAAAQKVTDDNNLLWVDIMEKRAAVKVSLQDPDGALADYQQCADRIRLPAAAAFDSDNDDDNKDLVLSAETTSLVERKAGLYLYMGQLSEGQEALTVYRQGIELLERVLQWRQRQRQRQQQSHHNSSSSSNDTNHNDDASDEMQVVTTTPLLDNDNDNENSSSTNPTTTAALLQETRRNLAAAYCTAAELYLTDLCFEEGAEQSCEAYMQQALKLITTTESSSSNNNNSTAAAAAATHAEQHSDVWQTLASLRLSQNRGLEAVQHILAAYDTMRQGCEALSALVGMRETNDNAAAVAAAQQQQATELLATEAVQNLPGFEFRCQTAKILLECATILKQSNSNDDNDNDDANGDDRETKCLLAAMDVLGSLLAENDDVVEIWILAGDASAALNNHPEVPAHYWQRAMDMLNHVKTSLEQQLEETSDEDEEEELNQELEEVLCQLEATQSKLDELLGATKMDED